MSSKEKKLSKLFITMMSKFFTRRWEKNNKRLSVGKGIKTMQNDEETFLFI